MRVIRHCQWSLARLPKTNALKPLALAMGIQGETPLGVKCHMK
ncbi:hypothetical protein HPHPA16_1581 [Helicobacter pylori Hp A-16]|nr:hypothetical protein HPHPA16_1581 [Helicobacter pylori Hp A-16]